MTSPLDQTYQILKDLLFTVLAVVRAKRKPQVTPVIILGYMRSGSSLTGDILQQNSDAFYVFEPLHDLQKQYYDEMEEMFPELQIRCEPCTLIGLLV